MLAKPCRLFARTYIGSPSASVAAAAAASTRVGTSFAAWICGGSPLFTEFISAVGFDAVVIDLQHGVGDLGPMLAAISAAGSPANPGAVTPKKPQAIVRVSQNLDGEIYKALDAGAGALICPMINSAADCESFVRASKYPPDGHRSFGPHRAILGWPGSRGDFVRAANAAVETYAMLETRGAIEDLDGILGIQGLTGVFIGPNDLGLALGHDPTDSPEGEVLAMVEHVLARSHEHGKKAAIFCSDPSTAKRMADAGFDMVVVGMDVAWAAGGAAKALAAAKGP